MSQGERERVKEGSWQGVDSLQSDILREGFDSFVVRAAFSGLTERLGETQQPSRRNDKLTY